VRRWTGPIAAVLACLTAGPDAWAQDRPESLQMDITGVGALTSAGAEKSISSITYVTFADPKRTSFSVTLPDRTVTFTGAQEAWSDDTHEVLTLDTIMVLAAGAVKDLPASGACQMEIAADATFVRKVDCSATTDQGAFALSFRLHN
jgi:hypothetical protein